MSSLTLKNIPEPLLERLRERAGADRRSLTQEILHLLEEALDRPRGSHGAEIAARLQADAWSALAGGWQSDLDPREEAERILAARTHGREVEL
jgi:plasmid stability protein